MRRVLFEDGHPVGDAPAYDEVEVPAEQGSSPPEIARAAERIAAAKPAVVVLFVARTVGARLVAAVEDRWPAHAARPIYISAGDTLVPYAPFLGANADRRRRVLSVISTSTSAANLHFVIRYNEAHEKHASPTDNPGSSYDAFYLLALAAYSKGDAPITGPALAQTFGRLTPPGPPVDVGPTQVFEALAAFGRGGRVDLEGTATALDFDLATGEAPSNFALLCAAIDGSGRATGESVESGVVFNAKTQRVEGVMRCP
jgi:hypothetical protein